MNRRQKLVQQQFLNNELGIIKRLKQVYGVALKDIDGKIEKLMERFDPETGDLEQSAIYQIKYQQMLKGQIEGILDQLQTKQYLNISDYLDECYEDGFVGGLFDLHGQDVPLMMPLNQEAMVRAVQLDSKISEGLYTRLGEDVGMLKKRITAQVSRSIATGISYQMTAKHLADQTRIGYNRAVRIARTEGHRIQCTAADDVAHAAKDRGADVAKQWDATLDGKTRDSHVAVDGEIRELDEAFSNGLQYPGDPAGSAAEVVNCRCAYLQRARWALEGAFTKMNNFTKQLETFESPEAYDEFKKTFFSPENKKYMNYVQQMEEKYGTKNFTKVLDSMTEREYKHYSKLLAENPVYNKKAVELSIDDINARSSDLLGELYERHRLRDNLNLAPYADLRNSKINPVNANYGNLSVETATVFDVTISELADVYDTPLQKIRTMTKEEYLGYKDSFAYVTHDYSIDSATLTINPAKCKSVDELTDRVKDMMSRGYCVNVSDELAVKYVPTHEFAHTLMNTGETLNNKTNWAKADYKKIKNARKEITAVYEEYMSEVETLTKQRKKHELDFLLNDDDVALQRAKEYSAKLKAVKLSDYSLQDADEFMAEAFTNEKIGVASNPYSQRVVTILDKYFGR